jgi:transposase
MTFTLTLKRSEVSGHAGAIQHRLSRSGDRRANSALYIVTIVRMRHHEPTRAYVERRTNEGLNKREIIRCLKRYIAREIYANLPGPQATSTPPTEAHPTAA